ncbi:MAG: hypothetical protein ABL930_09890 [Pseudobdellovibrio sp.]
MFEVLSYMSKLELNESGGDVLVVFAVKTKLEEASQLISKLALCSRKQNIFEMKCALNVKVHEITFGVQVGDLVLLKLTEDDRLDYVTSRVYMNLFYQLKRIANDKHINFVLIEVLKKTQPMDELLEDVCDFENLDNILYLF